jgi:hypothetical protein
MATATSPDPLRSTPWDTRKESTGVSWPRGSSSLTLPSASFVGLD